MSWNNGKQSSQSSIPSKRRLGSDEPELQVLGSPSPTKPARLGSSSGGGGGQKRPTSRLPSGSSQRAGGGYKPTSTLANSTSSYFQSSSKGSSILDKYNKLMGPKPVQRQPAVPGLSSSSGSSLGSLQHYSPSTALTSDQRERLSKLQKIFVRANPKDIKQAVLKFNTYQEAADWLAKRGGSNSNGMAGGSPSSPQSASLKTSSKVQINRSDKSIAQRYGTASKAASRLNRAMHDDEEDDINMLSPRNRTPASGQKKKLVKGSQLEPEQAEEIELSSDDSEEDYESEVDEEFDERLLNFLNTASQSDLADIASCSDKHAEDLISHRPFESLAQVQDIRLEQKARGSRKKPEGEKIVNEVSSTLRGYEAVDSLIKRCEQVGRVVRKGIEKWGVDLDGADAAISLTSLSGSGSDDDEEDDEDKVVSTRKKDAKLNNGDFFHKKPELLADDVQLKSYQQLGINWLNLLYKKKLSCILADEMGLGKTCQVIAFLAHLKASGIPGPHLIVVPSSTLENWLREFNRFAPSFKIEPYYGSQTEREILRDSLIENETEFDVMVTTYNLACGTKDDHVFLKTRGFNVCVYDEGHLLKNSDSERYNKLMKIRAQFRLLLTGTPLQNNLKELISLLSFILPDIFKSRKDDLSVIFKHRALVNAAKSGRNPLLSEQRITRAKAMMTPFVLRRKKDQVLKHLPDKNHQVEICDMDRNQTTIYQEQLQAAREREARKEAGESVKAVNLIMDLRNAAMHPLLFRRLYNDQTLRTMANELVVNEPYYQKEGNEQYIYEDMTVMSDFELHLLCEQFPNSIGYHGLKNREWMNSAKVQKLAEILPGMKQNGDRILIFSQFTQVLNILERVLSELEIKFLRLDGSTAVDVRQEMIDRFYQEESITVFLLSTKAGGFGINLACANTVIIHDLSFNPHDDKQAEDRAHRVGQTREVKVIRMVTRDTIDENILNLANTKLELDASLTQSEHDRQEEQNRKMIAEEVLKLAAPSAAASATPSAATSINPSRADTPSVTSAPLPINQEPNGHQAVEAAPKPAVDAANGPDVVVIDEGPAPVSNSERIQPANDQPVYPNILNVQPDDANVRPVETNVQPAAYSDDVQQRIEQIVNAKEDGTTELKDSHA